MKLPKTTHVFNKEAFMKSADAARKAFEDEEIRDKYPELMKQLDDIRTSISTLIASHEELQKRVTELEDGQRTHGDWHLMHDNTVIYTVPKPELCKDYHGYFMGKGNCVWCGKPLPKNEDAEGNIKEEVIKEIENMLPADIDLRPEIKEWTFSKNRDFAEGQQDMLERVKMAIDSVKEDL